MFGKRYPHYGPRGNYPMPYKRHSSGIFFLLIVLGGAYMLQINDYIPSQEVVPFWFLALVIIAVFFLFKRREQYY